MTGSIKALQTFPVKGLSPVPHERVALQTGQGFPGDRMFGFAKGNSGFDPSDPKPLPKDRFLVLLQYEALAGLKTRIDPVSLQFEVIAQDGTRHDFDLGTVNGQAESTRFFHDMLSLDEAERPFFSHAEPHRFTDVSVVSPRLMNAVSLINLASVQELSKKAGVEIDPARFRANILVDGWPPFAELDLVGQRIRLGQVTFEVLMRTRRCPATRVNPATAERDLDVPRLIKDHYGHLDMGVYVSACDDGALAIGDEAEIQN